MPNDEEVRASIAPLDPTDLTATNSILLHYFLKSKNPKKQFSAARAYPNPRINSETMDPETATF